MIIIIRPLTTDEDALEQLKERLHKTFGCPVEIIPEACTLSYAEAHDPKRRQSLAPRLLSVLGTEGIAEDEKILGIADADLYAPGLNFVFGQADMSSGKAVISLHRLGEEFYGLPTDRAKLLDRATKEAVHELGHILGLEHCQDSKCVMHFSNSLADTDHKQAAFCGQCRPKLIK